MCDNEVMAQEQEEQEMREFGIVDEHHVHAMFQAVEDTEERMIEGNEHLALTDFQAYAGVVLGMNGSRSGNEGFFSSIGDGLKAAWEYIKKIFKSIWQFFFGKDSEKELSDAEKEIKEISDKIKTLKKTKEPTAEELKGLETHLNTLVERMKTFIKSSKAAGTMTWREAKTADPGFKAISASINEPYTKLETVTEEFVKWFEGISSIVSVEQAMSDKFILQIKAMGNVGKAFKTNVSKMKGLIDTVEKEAKASRDLHANAERKANIRDLKAIMASSAALAGYTSGLTRGMVEAMRKAKKAYGVEVVKKDADTKK